MPGKIFQFTWFTSIVFAICLAGLKKANAQESKRWDYPALEHRISIRDGAKQDRLEWTSLIEQLKSADVVFLGESHDDDTTHQLQLAIYEAMLQARDNKVILAMEMFERDVQTHLNDYLAGKIDEASFLARSRPWGNYEEAYRPLVERAKTVGQPVVAANFPRPLLMKLSQAGNRGLESLGDDRSLAPDELLPNSALYWKRADNATRGHSMFMTVETDEASRLTSTQSLWDNSMGEACVKALAKYPGYQVVHLNGGFHTEYWDGTAAQVRQRNPQAIVKTVAIRTASNPTSARLIGAPSADYVIFVEERAKNLNDGDWKVVVGREQSYRLHIPHWATLEKPAPLLIWLSDDGLSAEDNFNYWKSVMANQAAILVLEPTHRQQERDMSLAGRWFWLDRFAHDISVGQQSVESAWQYALNRFAIDPQRVCLAGEGTGATLCASVALMTSKMDLNAIAIKPRQYSKIKDFPLPLLEDWGNDVPPKRTLSVIGSERDHKWWKSELQEYGSVGLKTTWHALPSNPWQADDQRSSEIAKSLGLNEPPRSTEKMTRKYLQAASSSAKEIHWLRMLAGRLSDNDNRVTVIGPDDQVEGKGFEKIDYGIDFEQARVGRVPLCPGAFGGTTILVLNADQAGELEKWIALETNDPLTARSRFHRTRIAIDDAAAKQLDNKERSLTEMLGKLLDENRKNVLIVPAEFYAGPDRMTKMAAAALPFIDQMTIHWLPGLGGEAPPR